MEVAGGPRGQARRRGVRARVGDLLRAPEAIRLGRHAARADRLPERGGGGPGGGADLRGARGAAAAGGPGAPPRRARGRPGVELGGRAVAGGAAAAGDGAAILPQTQIRHLGRMHERGHDGHGAALLRRRAGDGVHVHHHLPPAGAGRLPRRGPAPRRGGRVDPEKPQRRRRAGGGRGGCARGRRPGATVDGSVRGHDREEPPAAAGEPGGPALGEAPRAVAGRAGRAAVPGSGVPRRRAPRPGRPGPGGRPRAPAAETVDGDGERRAAPPPAVHAAAAEQGGAARGPSGAGRRRADRPVRPDREPERPGG